MFNNDKLVNSIASGRIESLYKLAKKRTIEEKSSTKLAKRYIKIAKEISRHYKVKLPTEIRNGVCKKCNSVLVAGLNCSVRTSSASKSVIYKCECGSENRIHIIKRSK